MNRNEEYALLMEELNLAPLKLDFTLDRALMRRKDRARRRKRAVFAPLGTLAGLLAVFVLLVNVSPTFAYAAGRIPLLRELAQFVATSPSLSAAVENEFVQPVGQEQTQDGITARIEYVIVDQKQLNIFFTLDSDVYTRLGANASISDAEGKSMWGYSVVGCSYMEENGTLLKAVVDFQEGIMPDSMILTLEVYDNNPTERAPVTTLGESLFADDHDRPELITKLSFPLSFNPDYTAKGEMLTLNQDFVIDGQRIVLDSVEIYPTTMRLNFSFDPKNTAWPTDLHFELENERGESFGSSSSGLKGYGFPLFIYVLESPYFSDSKHLNLRFTGADWLDKGKERVHLDLVNETIDFLPEGVSFLGAEKHDDGWIISFEAEPSNMPQQLWSSECYSDTQARYFMGMSWTSSDEESKAPSETALVLKDYPYDEVWLCPNYTRRTELEMPIELNIK